MQKENILTISNKIEVLFLPLNQILYIQADGNYCNVYFIDGSMLNTLTYQRAEIARMIHEQASEECSKLFVMLGKSYLVNSCYILRIQPSKQLLTFCVNEFGTTHKITLQASTKALSQLKTEIALERAG